MPLSARAYVSCVLAAGLFAIVEALRGLVIDDIPRYLLFVLLTMLGSGLKIRLPRVTGTYSLSFLFLLVGLVNFSLPETVLAGCLSVLVQCLWRPKQKPEFIQVIFSVAVVAVSIVAAHAPLMFANIGVLRSHRPALLSLVACLYFVVNTLLVSIVVSLVSDKPISKIWEQWVLSSFPYYLVGSAFAGLATMSGGDGNWISFLVTLPLMYLVFRYYRMHVEMQFR